MWNLNFENPSLSSVQDTLFKENNHDSEYFLSGCFLKGFEINKKYPYPMGCVFYF
jgi:hypothetical protein